MYIAETFSRGSLPKSTGAVAQNLEAFRIELETMNVKRTILTASTFQRLQRKTSMDPTLKSLHKIVITKWPQNKSAVADIRLYSGADPAQNPDRGALQNRA